MRVYGEPLIQFLTLDESEYFNKDWEHAARRVMSPPFRSKEHQAGLWAGPAAGSLQAQDNVYPITFVDATGAALPVGVDAVTGHVAAASATESVYLAFHPDTPSGDYYVHVTDVLNGNLDRVLSLNDPNDRFVTVTNLGAGVILI